MVNRINLMLGAVVVALCAGALFVGGGRLLANVLASGNIPELMSYQGYATDSGGTALNGSYDMVFKIYDSSSAGTKYWEETHTGVSVNSGYFAAMLGSQGTRLTPSVFEGESRYLEVTIGTDSPLPRQRIASVPYAFQAYEARTAVEATYAMTATVALNAPAGGGYEHLIVVAKSGGDYTSVAAALDSITSPSSSSRYLVYVAPGTYAETDLVDVKPYVHLQGAGPNVTVITSTRSDSTSSSSAATVRVQGKGRLSDIAIYNDAASNSAVAVYVASDALRDTVIDNIVAKAQGVGGTNHAAVLLADAEPTIRDSLLMASGASGFGTSINAALRQTDADDNAEQPLVEGSSLIGGETLLDDCTTGTGTGYALHLAESSINVRDSYLCGDYRAVGIFDRGVPVIQHSTVRTSSNNSAFLIERTAGRQVRFAASSLGYFNLVVDTGTDAARCVVSYAFGTLNELTILCEDA